MQYMGGKSRISKQIASILTTNLGGCRPFVSLFCGSCSIEAKVQSPVKILNDKHPYLIAMWKGLQNGWRPPDTITKKEYYYIKEHKDENPALTGFVGFGCSFGGKWFGGLAANKRGDNYCARAERSLLKDFEGVKDANFTCLDYRDVIVPNNAIVYADPPYIGVTGYSLGRFDHEEFWEYMRNLSQRCTVFISEQTAPDDFEIVWEQEVTRQLDYNKNNSPIVTEKLYIYNHTSKNISQIYRQFIV